MHCMVDAVPRKVHAPTDGQPVSFREPCDAIAKRIAFCPEDRKRDGIIGDLSIRENIMLAVQARKGFMHPMSHQEQSELAEKYIKLLGIATPNAEKKVGELSGGNQQKCIVARWIATHPKVLILDDSTSAVDTATDAKIRAAFATKIPGTTKLIISQRISSVQDADRILVLDDGRVSGFAPHEELLANNQIYQEIYNVQMQSGGDFDQKMQEGGLE